MRIAVVLPAGGSGKRFGTSIPKQFQPLAGRSIIAHTVQAFLDIEEVTQVIVALPRTYLDAPWNVLGVSSSRIDCVEGGAERQHSVGRALQALKPGADVILVHDAVRPLVSQALIMRVARQAAEHGACVPGLKPKETVKRVDEAGVVSETLDREELRLIQTPQGFIPKLLLDAHRRAADLGYLTTDEASLAEKMSIPVVVIDGEEFNIKITSASDAVMAEHVLRLRQPKQQSDSLLSIV